jgi:hypothetical protein
VARPDPAGLRSQVILIQEQLSKNRIIIEKDAKGLPSASVRTLSPGQRARWPGQAWRRAAPRRTDQLRSLAHADGRTAQVRTGC